MNISINAVLNDPELFTVIQVSWNKIVFLAKEYILHNIQISDNYSKHLIFNGRET